MDFPARTPQQLRDILKGYRLRRNLTQAQLAKLTGLDQARISRIEANPGSTTVRRLYDVLSALGVELVLREKQPSDSPTQSEW